MTQATTTTVRSSAVTFPECLEVQPTDLLAVTQAGGRAAFRATVAWYSAHNRALADWRRRRVGAMSDARPEEVAILDLAAAIDGWRRALTPDGDGFGTPDVLADLFAGFRAALNFQTGRLDSGTLDSWAGDTLRGLGWDPDLNDWAK